MIVNKFNFSDYANELIKALYLVDQKQIDIFFDVFNSYVGSNSSIYLLGNEAKLMLIISLAIL